MAGFYSRKKAEQGVTSEHGTSEKSASNKKGAPKQRPRNAHKFSSGRSSNPEPRITPTHLINIPAQQKSVASGAKAPFFRGLYGGGGGPPFRFERLWDGFLSPLLSSLS